MSEKCCICGKAGDWDGGDADIINTCSKECTEKYWKDAVDRISGRTEAALRAEIATLRADKDSLQLKTRYICELLDPDGTAVAPIEYLVRREHRDAERYRWLRDHQTYRGTNDLSASEALMIACEARGVDWDHLIDAAMAKDSAVNSAGA